MLRLSELRITELMSIIAMFNIGFYSSLLSSYKQIGFIKTSDKNGTIIKRMMVTVRFMLLLSYNSSDSNIYLSDYSDWFLLSVNNFLRNILTQLMQVSESVISVIASRNVESSKHMFLTFSRDFSSALSTTQSKYSFTYFANIDKNSQVNSLNIFNYSSVGSLSLSLYMLALRICMYVDPLSRIDMFRFSYFLID